MYITITENNAIILQEQYVAHEELTDIIDGNAQIYYVSEMEATEARARGLSYQLTPAQSLIVSVEKYIIPLKIGTESIE